MSKVRPRVYIAIAATIVLVLFRHYGRSIWVPVKNRITGARTTEEVLSKLESRMATEFTNLTALVESSSLTLVALKQERRLELWRESDRQQKLVKSYAFAAFSGELGPKLREGDGQIPEGIYRLKSLNPNSSYHLSIELNYPNEIDQIRGAKDNRSNLGGEIFIHGKDVTVGCIPVGDTAIEELFYVIAKNGIEDVTVIIAPLDFRLHPKMGLIDVVEIEWETELYAEIRAALIEFHRIDPE